MNRRDQVGRGHRQTAPGHPGRIEKKSGFLQQTDLKHPVQAGQTVRTATWGNPAKVSFAAPAWAQPSP
jgi:hypothetical protein